MPPMYPGLYNSDYVTEPLEFKFAQDPGGYLSPYLIGIILSFLIAGVLLSQAMTYWRSKLFRDDSLTLRLHVALVLLLTILKLVQIGAVAIMDFSIHYGDYLFLVHKNWLFRISVLSATIVSATVQVFFIKRVAKFSHNSIVFLFPTILAWLGSIASAIWVTVVFPEDWAHRSYSFVIAGRVAPALTLVCDILVTGFALFHLLRARMTIPEESPVSRIIRIMLESVTLPCITAALNVVFDDQAAGGYVFLFVALTPLFQTFSMLYSLNSRVYFRERKAASGGIGKTFDDTPVMGHSKLPSSATGLRALPSPFGNESEKTFVNSPNSGTNTAFRPLLLNSGSSTPSPRGQGQGWDPRLPLRMQLGDSRPDLPLEVPWSPGEDSFAYDLGDRSPTPFRASTELLRSSTSRV